METTQLAEQFESLQTPVKEERALETDPKTSHKSRVIPSRCTRSQITVNWTVQEMLTLVNEIFSVEGDCLKALPSYQKWKIIADNCAALDVVRSSNQCRRKWDSLLLEYKKIKEWESQPGIDSYWSLESERRKEFGLPDFFDRELFRSIDDLVKVEEDRSDTDSVSDSDAEPDMLDVIMDSGLKKRRRRPAPQKNKLAMEQEMAVKLCEKAEFIHAILRGDLNENTDNGLAELKNQSKLTRQQGDELIKVFGSLVGTLDQLSNLIQ